MHCFPGCYNNIKEKKRNKPKLTKDLPVQANINYSYFKLLNSYLCKNRAKSENVTHPEKGYISLFL